MSCIPSNPDVSGIGVRIAIYAQNLLCFAPVVADVWDGEVSADEIRGVKDQSIGMLAIAFSILISAIIEATTSNIIGQGLSRFHAAIILDLSWMNNTSTWIWFLLYVHHCTKPPKDKLELESTGRRHTEAVPAEWSAWIKFLVSPFHVSDTRLSCGEVVKHIWNLLTNKPVLTLGSAHLSLMASIGIWLWSRPAKFGTPIDCDPSLSVLGGAVPFSSHGLRIFSLAMYSLLVVPGINLVPPFIFFLALHITYNMSREHYRRLRKRLGAVSYNGTSQYLESDVERRAPSWHFAPQEFTHRTKPKSHTAFLVVGLACLAIINVILMVDIELTLRRDKHDESSGENEWGFGQVLALMLLVVPIRDFVSSVSDIQENIKREQEAKEKIQRNFEDHLRKGIKENKLEAQIFKEMIKQGADPNVKLDNIQDSSVETLLEFAAYVGNEDLVMFLAKRRVKHIERGFLAATLNCQFATAYLLRSESGSDAQSTTQSAFTWIMAGLQTFDSEVRQATMACLSSVSGLKGLEKKLIASIPTICTCLTSQDWRGIRQAAVECLTEFGKQADLQKAIRGEVIPTVIKFLDSEHQTESEILNAAISCLMHFSRQSALQQALQPAITHLIKLLITINPEVRMESVISCISAFGLQQEVWPAIAPLVKLLEHSDPHTRNATIDCLCNLGAQAGSHSKIWSEMSSLVHFLKHRLRDVRESAINCLVQLAEHAGVEEIIIPAISEIGKVIEHGDPQTRIAMIGCLGSFGHCKQSELQKDIGKILAPLIQSLQDSDRDVREKGIHCLSGLGAEAWFQKAPGDAISSIIGSLKDVDPGIRQSAIAGLSNFGTRAPLQNEVQPAISKVVARLRDPNSAVRCAAVDCLSEFGAQATMQQDIMSTHAILHIVKLLRDSDRMVRKRVIACLSRFSLAQGILQATAQRETGKAISSIIESLKHSDPVIREAAVICLYDLSKQSGFQQALRPAIPHLIESISNEKEKQTTYSSINCLSSFSAQEEMQNDLYPAILSLVKLLRHPNHPAVNCLSNFGKQANLQQRILDLSAIHSLEELLKHPTSDVCTAALSCLSNLSPQARLQPEIVHTIPKIIKLLESGSSDVRRAAVKCLSNFSPQVGLQKALCSEITSVVKALKDSDWNVGRAVVNCLSNFGAQEGMRQEIANKLAIPRIVEALKDRHLAADASDCLVSFGAHAVLRSRIQAEIPSIAASLADHDYRIRRAVVKCLSRLRTQVELQLVIRPAISGLSGITKLLQDDKPAVRLAAIEYLSKLGPEDAHTFLIAIGPLTRLTPSVRASILKCLPQIMATALNQQHGSVKRAKLNKMETWTMV